MTDMTSNPQNGLDWEDACLDPHHVSLEQGKGQGRQAGALAGFRNGQALGQNKGLEFGFEVGFYRGVLAALLIEEESSLSTSSSSSSPATQYRERVRKSIQKLQEAIDAFPSPDEVFSCSHRVSDSSPMSLPMEHSSTIYGVIGEGNNNKGNDSEDTSKYDIINKLQRIRARFKLLAVQMGKPQFSLKNALLETPSLTATKSSGDDEGW